MADETGSKTIFDHLDDDEMLKTLPDSLTASYQHGLKADKIEIYDTSRVHVVHEEGIDYEIHLLPSLSEKPPPSKDLPDLSTRPEKDVFAPPFVPEELVGDLRDHFVVLNKFCFLPEQFVLLTKRWAVQAEPLEEMDLWIAYKICRAFEEKGKPLLAFLNCGKRSGGSQPHRHIQFVPLDSVPPTEKLAMSLELSHKAMQPEPVPLPLPYLHLVSPLPSSSQITAGSLHAQYLHSLSHHPPSPHSTSSHNMLLTTQHLHTIPRSERDNVLTLGDNEFTLGPNGLGFAGKFFVEPGQEKILEAAGVGKALRGVVGFGREEAGKGKSE